MGAALLETALERLIKHSLKRKDKELNNQLFQQRGPMGDFYSKIIVASAFAVISESLAAELTIIRNVRNVFAHATANLSFEIPEIKSEIKRSILLRVINEKMSERLGEGPLRLEPISIRNEFVMMVRIVFAILDSDQTEKGGLALSI